MHATAFPALVDCGRGARGAVGAVGVGMNQAELLTRFVERLDLDVVLLAGRYSLLDQTALRTLLPACLEHHGVPLLAAALQFALGHPAVSSVLVGARSVREVTDNATAFTTAVPAEAWAELRAAGLIGDEIPVPAAVRVRLAHSACSPAATRRC